jgi:hypothetical protein
VLADDLREPIRGGHCMEPVAWVGRWKFTKGSTKVWSCERQADELVGAEPRTSVPTLLGGSSEAP